MLSWKGPIRIIESSCWPCTEHAKGHTMCLRALSKGFLNSLRLGAVTTALGSLFQCPSTLWVKNFFLISNLNLPWLSLLLLPGVLPVCPSCLDVVNCGQVKVPTKAKDRALWFCGKRDNCNCSCERSWIFHSPNHRGLGKNHASS